MTTMSNIDYTEAVGLRGMKKLTINYITIVDRERDIYNMFS